MKQIKKTIAFILSVVLIVCAFPASAFAATGHSHFKTTKTNRDGTLQYTVCDYKNERDLSYSVDKYPETSHSYSNNANEKYTYSCPNCSVSLSWHSSSRRLMCHYCGHVHALDAACPACGGALSFTGAGTETVVQELTELFPDTPILRMDADAVSAAGGHDVLFEQFRREKIPIMVGTQMVTKGLNFSNVTLVGVLSADQSLYAADYRASERTFSLLTQVIGRGGRGDRPGRAVIQTFTPENDVIRRVTLQRVQEVLSSLPPRERLVLEMRYGLTDGKLHTLEEVGEEFNVTRERIRQIEAKALRKLRHPSRSKVLKDFLN